MNIQPEANNAIQITLDDNSTIKMHHTQHGEHDSLFLSSSGKHLIVETRKGLDWEEITTSSIIKITVA